MLLTPLGKIDICVDGTSVTYEYKEIDRDRRCMDLNGRFFVCVPFLPDKKTHFISCRILDYVPSKDDGIASGERLECKSFYQGKVKLSIGVEGDTGDWFQKTYICNYDYGIRYLKDGIQYEILPTTKTAKYLFGIAWIEGYHAENEVQTWFGADPTLMKQSD